MLAILMKIQQKMKKDQATKISTSQFVHRVCFTNDLFVKPVLGGGSGVGSDK